MPRRIDPKEAARRRQRRRYAGLRADLRTLARRRGFSAARRLYESGTIESATFLIETALRRARADGELAPGIERLIIAIAEAAVEDRREGIEPPIEFRAQKEEERKGRVVPSNRVLDTPIDLRPRGRRLSAPRWLADLPVVLTEIWMEERAELRWRRFREDGHLVAAQYYPVTPRSRLPYRVQRLLKERGYRPALRTVKRALSVVDHIRAALEHDVEQYGYSGRAQTDPATVARLIRGDAALVFAAPDPIREAAVRRALLDLGIPVE